MARTGGQTGRRRAHHFVGFEIVEFARDVIGQRGRRAVEHDPARRHADQAVAIAAREIERMQVADHGDAEMLVDAQQRVHHDPGVARIERCDRLVGKNDVGLLHQRARDRDALLLAAGELVGALRRERRHIELLERRHRHRLVLFGPQLRQRAPGRNFARRPISTLVSTSSRPTRLNCWKIMAERARHCRSSRPRSAVTSTPSNRIRPSDRLGEAVDHAQQGRLAGAGAADHADKAAGRNRE